jgi:DNA-binding beta-propeller fold protein YncE
VKRFVLLALLLMMVSGARADEDTIDMTHAVFVAIDGSAMVPFIDPDTDRVVGTIDVGLVPSQIELASSIGKLLAIDGKTARVNLADVVTGAVRTVPLDLTPGRMTISADGLTAALTDLGTSHVVLVDLLRHQLHGTIETLPPSRDMVFSADGRKLFVAGERRGLIDVMDVATVRQETPIETGLPLGNLALSRTPDGRRLFVKPDGDGIVVLDLEHRRAISPIQAGAASTVAYPSATGKFLLVADNQPEAVQVIRNSPETALVNATSVLKAATGVVFIYTAWFDTLALVPSTTAKRLFLFDLEAMRPAGSIGLDAAPARGAVTPDGQKLYLPLPDAGSVAVVDARRRAMVASIALNGHPKAVRLAGSYGVCH